MKSVFLTGSSGFIGNKLSPVISDSFHLRQGFRVKPVIQPLYDYVLFDLNDSSSVSLALKDIDVVVHCAGLAHLRNDSPIEQFRKVNVDMTLNLAQAAVDSGVKRFIYLSSVGVNGNANTSPFTEKNTPSPVEDYAISKLEAENGLKKIALSTAMEVVIIRSPMVYGPNAPGNFGKLVCWSQKMIPLPFGSIHNKRSLIALENLVSFIVHCINHPKAANEVFLISDGKDVSTTELLQKVVTAFGRGALLLPVPVELMTSVAKLVGREDLANKIFGSLCVDSSKARDLLNWRPVVTMEEQLKIIADSYSKECR